jgi:hypothetical protein
LPIFPAREGKKRDKYRQERGIAEIKERERKEAEEEE